jgi:hypothetical protein
MNMTRSWLQRVVALPFLLVVASGPAYSATPPIYVSPDVPTHETLGGTDVLYWQFYKYDAIAYTSVFAVPGNPLLADIHRLDAPGSWLFALETPSDLAGALTAIAQTRDIVKYDGSTGTYALFFCGGGLPTVIPDGVGIDAVYLDGGDDGNLIVSFGAPVTLGPFSFNPADLARYVRTGPGCGGWTLAATNPEFKSATAGTGIPSSVNLVAAARAGGKYVFSFDVPTTIGPPGLTTYIPGQLVAWDGVSFSLFQGLSGWPIQGEVTGVSTGGNPGRVPPTIHVDKAPGAVTVSWSPSCSGGADDYEIYEGTIGSWYSHTSKVCTDTGHDFTETFVPGAGSDYYLVVPKDSYEEGSYGRNSSGAERPVGIATCVAPQVLSDCP